MARTRGETGELRPVARERVRQVLVAAVPERLRGRLGAGRRRGMLVARRFVACALLLLAGVLGARSAFAAPSTAPSETTAVVLAAHDLAPGTVLDRDDVELRTLPAESVPDGALRDVAAVVGRTLAGAARAGAPLTDVRLVGPENLAVTTGSSGTVAVPVRLAGPSLTSLLRPGTKVDVLAMGGARGAAPGNDTGTILLRDATVVTVRTGSGDPSPPEARAREGTPVVLAVPREAAPRVAAASLRGALTVSLR